MASATSLQISDSNAKLREVQLLASLLLYYGANKERLRSAWKSETGITSFSLTHPRDGIATKRKSISVTEVQIHS